VVIQRSFHYLSEDTFILLLVFMVRPHLEFCNNVTCPTTVRDMNLMRYRFLKEGLIALCKYTSREAINPAPEVCTVFDLAKIDAFQSLTSNLTIFFTVDYSCICC
jgi:hypothetical protein